MKLLRSIVWPDNPPSEWDDLDRMNAEIIHEHNCNRWPHRIARRLILKGQWSWNRWVRNLAWRLEGPLDVSGDDLRVHYVEWVGESDDI